MTSNSLYRLNSRRSLLDRGMEGFETGSFGLQVMEPREIRPLDWKSPLHSPAPRPSLSPNSPNLKVSTGGATTAESSVRLLSRS